MLSDWLAVFIQRRTKADASLVVPSPLQALSVIYIQNRPRRAFLQPIQLTTKTIATGNIESSRTKPMHQPRPPSGSFPPTQHTTPSFQSTPSTKPSPPILQQPFQHCPPFTYVLLLWDVSHVLHFIFATDDDVGYQPNPAFILFNPVQKTFPRRILQEEFYSRYKRKGVRNEKGQTKCRRNGTSAKMRITLCYVITRTSPNSDKEPIVNLTLQVIPSSEMGSCGYGMNQSGHNPLSHCKWSRW
uniref:Uncharacterized protein n=1 Tax=Vespula pensylvanica TaxID=30213 RepID=A0A834P2Q4_VESPE|nr:hypothetical protein H0235_008264 [Vespula pensylvanica]